jgi:hypothetical protein
LLFHQHIIFTVAKGHSIAYWTLRTFQSRASKLMKTLLKSLIVCHIEYACVVWSPTDALHTNLLEGVQKKFTSRFACFQTYDDVLEMPVCTTSYCDRLKALKIYSLERRRERYLILYIYKIIIGLVLNPGFIILYDPRRKLRVQPKSAAHTAPGWVKNHVIRASYARDQSYLTAFHHIYENLKPSPSQARMTPHDTKRNLITICQPSKTFLETATTLSCLNKK